MKIKLYLVIFFLLNFINSLTAGTVSVDWNDISYTVDLETNEAEVYGPVSSSTTITDLEIPDYIDYNNTQIPVTSIRNSAFSYNRNLKGSLTIGKNIRTIGNYAFRDCSGLTGELKIPDSVQTIGNFAFANGAGFSGDLKIPDSVETIGEGAFWVCSGFTGNLSIGNSVQIIGDYAFINCSGFTRDLKIPDSVTEIGAHAFDRCPGFTGNLTIGNSVQIIGDYAFYGCPGFSGDLKIPDSVQTIGEWAFYGCLGFTGNLTIGNSVQIIGDYAFYGCPGFTGNLTIGNSVQTIGKWAFSGCSGFTGELIIPESVLEISPACFTYCENFTSLVITSSDTKIYYSAFSGCNFKTITCQGITPPECIYGVDVFYHDSIFDSTMYRNSILYVPAQSIDLYKNATEWEKFTNMLPIQDEPTTITLNIEDLKLIVGQIYTLEATVNPPNTPDQSLTWNSQSPGIASVGSNGEVTALSKGTATITATCGSATAECRVTVYDSGDIKVKPGSGTTEGNTGDTPANNTASGGSLTGNDLTLRVSQKGIVTLQLPDDLTEVPTLEWSLANGGDNYVTLQKNSDTEASFTGVAMGKTQYYVKIQGESDPILEGNITVIAQYPMTSLSLSPAEITVARNAQAFKVTANYGPGNADVSLLEWSNSQPSVAEMKNQNGAEVSVQPVSTGQTVITVRALDGSELTAFSNVTVTNPVDNNFGFNFDDAAMGGLNGISIYLGDTYRLQPKAQEGHDLPEGITWKSSDPQTVSVGADGTVTGLKLGSAEITATAQFNGEEVSATCTVTVIAVPATEIQLNTKDATIYIGETVTINATVKPDNTTYPAISWSSNNTGVATVDGNGTVTGLSDGTATITAKCGDVEAYCKVTVNPVTVESIEMELQDVTLFLGESVILSAKVLPPNTTQQDINWASGDPSVVLIDADGQITAVGLGKTIVIASCGSVSATCQVTVIPIPAESIEMDITDVTLLVGSTTNIIAKVLPVNTTYQILTWFTSNPDIAKIEGNGTILAVGVGTATITAAVGTVSATCKVTVIPIPATSLTLNEEALTLLVGATTTLTATVSPANTTDKTLTWSSDNEGVATVSATGVVTAIAPGTATITVRNGNNTATCKVTVNPITSTSVTLNVEDITMKVGATSTLTATVSPANTTNKTLTWSSDNEGVATVSATGVVTAIAPGTATITVRNGNATATCKVTVLAETATSISLNIEDQTIYVAATTQLIVSINPVNVTDKTVTWTSSRPEIATVTDYGLVTGVSVGSTTITATCGSVSATCVITVIARETAPINVTTSDLNVKTTDGQQVLMWVSTEGGNPDGWSFSWTYNGEVVSTEKNLEITARNQNDIPVTETYIVNVRNVNDGTLTYNETFTFTIEIWPLVEMPFEDGADDESLLGNNDGTTQDEDGWWERNGIHVETLQTREGNTVGMWTETPQGGYNNDWDYLWTISGEEIGQGESIGYESRMAPGNPMQTEAQTPLVTMTNYGPEGDVWYQASAYGPTVEVYRSPQTPLQMLRKGDGTSHVFVLMMPLNDSQISQYNYQFAYGYTDASGNDNLIDVTTDRYCRAEEDVYWNAENNFWAYSLWQYPDGSVVSSGRRYLDGSVDEDFDASVFNGTGLSNLPSQGSTRTAVYTLDGQYLGSEADNLAPGIYIRQTVTDGVSVSEKFIVR